MDSVSNCRRWSWIKAGNLSKRAQPCEKAVPPDYRCNGESDIRGARIGFDPDIKPIGMVFVNLVFKFLKRRSQFKGELLQKDFTESQAQEAIIKMN